MLCFEFLRKRQKKKRGETPPPLIQEQTTPVALEPWLDRCHGKTARPYTWTCRLDWQDWHSGVGARSPRLGDKASQRCFGTLIEGAGKRSCRTAAMAGGVGVGCTARPGCRPRRRSPSLLSPQ